MHAPQWNLNKSAEIYHANTWGRGYFTIDENGHVTANPTPGSPSAPSVSLMRAVDELEAQGGCLPAIFRFPAIIEHRASLINKAFRTAISASGYRNSQTTCYPIKTNHRRRVMESLRGSGVGLEVGTKAELLVGVDEIARNKELPLLCNGYKDRDYLEFATRLSMSGIDVTVTLENSSEVVGLIACAKKLGACPKIGLRLRLTVLGSTPWANSSGEDGMFGFPTMTLIAAIDLLQDAGLGDHIRMLHYHVGSQISNLNCVAKAASEAAKIYCELSRDGVPLTTLDIGGGLAVQYDQSKPDSFNSKDYSVEKYAETVVASLQNECEIADVEHPVIYCESGRAVVAHHSVFIFEAFGNTEIATEHILPEADYTLPELKLLKTATAASSLNIERARCLHEVIQVKYRAGLACIRTKAEADRLWQEAQRKTGTDPSLTYYGNLSIFQSLPDVWGIKQIFPVMPIHRLDEFPEVNAKISDITCDSDGKFSGFQTGVEETIPLHPLQEGERYMLGVFNTGAYQETIGDIHNLLARTSAMSIICRPHEEPKFHLDYVGDNIAKVIEPVGFCDGEILDNLMAHFEDAAAENIISAEFSQECTEHAERLMESTTYMELNQRKEWRKEK